MTRKKPEIEIKHGKAADAAFEAMLRRISSGESELVGMETHGLEDEDVVLTVRLFDLVGDVRQLEFQRGPKSNNMEIDDLRRLAEAMVKQATMLFDMADTREAIEAEDDEDDE
jgi:hypothetical protein